MTARQVALPWLLLLAACAENRAEKSRVAVADSTGITIVESIVDDSTPVCAVAREPTVTIGVTEGPPEYQLFRTFGAKRLSDGRIAVVNQGSQELRLYDPQGKFLTAAGGRGEGPGAFRDAFVLVVLPGDTMWVGDYPTWSWEVFAPDGSWIRGVTPTPPYINTTVSGVLDDGRMVMGVRSYGEAPPNRFAAGKLTALLHAGDGSLVDTLGVYADGLHGRFEDVPMFVASPLFDSSGRLVVGGSRVIVGHTSRAELRVHEVEDTLRLDRVVRWTAEVRPVTAGDIEAERARISEQYADADPAMRRQLVDPLIREDRPAAEHFPTYSSVELGRDGRIWVRGYRHPAETADDEWLIFAPDGALQCRVTVERFEQMPDFGSDYILVMKRDELGVERIFQYALGPPTPVL